MSVLLYFIGLSFWDRVSFLGVSMRVAAEPGSLGTGIICIVDDFVSAGGSGILVNHCSVGQCFLRNSLGHFAFWNWCP